MTAIERPIVLPDQVACTNCKFWISDGQLVGACRRYPHIVGKFATDWCGEFARPDKATAEPAQKPELVLEPDDEYRDRLLLKIGENTVNSGKATVAAGADLDEIGSWYGLARKSAPAHSS